MDKAYSFDLVYDPWIPCMDLQGQMQHLGLLSVLTKAHALQGVHADVPPTTAAILRLLLVILHRNFGPENMGVWFELWQNGQFDVGHLQAYLEKWRERFDLFHPQVPFYQSYSAEVKPKSINSLMMHIASGNAATLFNHETELGNTTFLPAEAAQALVTVQAFGLAGLCNPRLGLVYTDAPCARGMVLFLSGETLFETLMLNLVRYDRYRPFFQDSGDMPAWEKADPFIPLRTHPIGYLDFLTWQKRRIQLIPEKVDGRVVVRQVTTAPGLAMEAAVDNPMHFYFQKDKKERKLLRFRETRALWRDSAALLHVDREDYSAPEALKWAVQLTKYGLLTKPRLQMMALGMSTDPGKQKVFFYRAERFLFSTELLTNPELLDALQACMDQAEEAYRMLWVALRKMGSLVLSPDADQEDIQLKIDPKNTQALYQHWDSEIFFWSELEPHFSHLMKTLPEDQALATDCWARAVYRIARQVFEHVVRMSGESVQQLKAAIRARGMLYNGLKQVFKFEIDKPHEEKSKMHPFIQTLLQLKEAEDFRTLAVLRQGLGTPASRDYDMQDIIDPYISEGESGTWRETVYYLIAALFAYYPENIDKGNMGGHLRFAGPYGSVQEQYIEKRISLLLSTSIEDIPIQLFKAVNLFKLRRVKVNWGELFIDLLNWEESDQCVQHKWANAFWGYGPSLVDLEHIEDIQLLLEV